MKRDRSLVYIAAIAICVVLIAVAIAIILLTRTAPSKRQAPETIVIVAPQPQQPQQQNDPRLPSTPINVSTRGETSFQQIGVLYSVDDKERVLPLYGRPTYVGSQKWNYYTKTDGFQSMQLALQRGNDCLDNIGCRELDEDDVLVIPELGATSFKVRKYQTAAPRYIP